MKKITGWLLTLGLIATQSLLANESPTPPAQAWSFNKTIGTFDRAALQRGFQVYKEVCAACHSLKYVRYEKLKALGFSAAEAKAIARSYQVSTTDDEGNPIQVPASLGDHFTGSFANDKAARAANGGSLPPDLSLMTKARKHGADYVYALLTSYRNPPAGVHLMAGMYYNLYFPGHQIAMAPPLAAGQVTYADGKQATVDQMASDVATFLTWTAEPELEARKRMGIKVMIFLAIFASMLYIVMRRTWQKVKNGVELEPEIRRPS